jgi:hypothetical protein
MSASTWGSRQAMPYVATRSNRQHRCVAPLHRAIERRYMSQCRHRYGEVVYLHRATPPAAAANASHRSSGGDWIVKAELALMSARLSLADPFGKQPALPCTFAAQPPTLRLACPGHASWAVRSEPRRERDCRRVDAPAEHDAHFMSSSSEARARRRAAKKSRERRTR